MKHKFLKKVIASSITISTLLTLVPMKASAAWIKNYYGNWSYTEGYSYATGWRQIGGAWYFFDNIGQMITGWIKSGDSWYYADLSGVMQTGVIQVEGKIYLFSENGAMQTGKCIIGGSFYDFDDNGIFVGNEAPVPAKAFDYYGNNTIAYIPSQIVDEGASMSSDIPLDGSEKITQYKVKFKDPEAEDDEDELLKTRTIDEDTTITLYKPKKSGYNFVEWNTDSDGDGTSYEYGDTIKVKKNITLYAQWEKEETDEVKDEKIEVDRIVVSGTNGVTMIKTKGGGLQMSKKVLPGNATTQTVTWSVTNVTGKATISSTGKLTAVSDGTVIVRATATDGSKVYGEVTITISGQ